jgi:hypothetical protein
MSLTRVARALGVPSRLLLLSFLIWLPCHAQQTTATLLGAVVDSSGAAVVGVKVTASSLATNIQRETITDQAGNYTLPSLPAGDYRVTATHEGFQVQRIDKVTLQVEQSARLDFTLKIGNVTETIEVNASAVVLQTENASVGTVIDGGKIVDLPLNGRNFIQLAQLIPGVQAGTPGSITVRRGRGSVGQTDAAYGSTAASANGSRDTANRFYLDGVEVMDYDAMTYSFSPSVDSLAEFKVQTSTYSAEYGGAPGGQVNMITKSGSNQYHGTLWEFNRNDQLTQSYDAIAQKSVTSPRLNRNQFGANFGGPVWIPKAYKGTDKTFFFFNWESGYAAQGASPSYRIVPTVAQRNGDFRGLVDSKGNPITLKDPLGIGIVGNQVPKSLLSPQTQAFLNYEPLPNTSNGVFNYLTAAQSAVSWQKNFTGRVDHSLSARNLISGRYTFNDTYEAGTPIWGHDQRNNLGRTQNVEASWTWTIRPTLVNEARGGWHRFNEAEVFGTTNDANYDVVGKMGLPLVSRLPEEYGPPSISVSGPDGVFNMYDLQRQIGPRIRSNSIMPFTDTLSWQKGRHFFKFGGELDYRGVTFGQARAPRGQFTFDGTYTGSAVADFMLGYIRSDNINPTHTNTDLYDYWFAGFVNDEWKATPRLTLTFGLRYDYFQRYKQKDDKFVDIYLNGFAITGNAVTTQSSPYGRELLAPDRNNFGPRFGLAWRPPIAGETVIRAGYGIYYTPQISNAIFAMAEGAQATAGATVTGNIVGTPNVFFSNPFALSQATGSLNFAVSNDQNLKDSYIQQWNVNLQRKLPGGVVLDVGYVGSKGTDLIVTYGDLNRPIQVVDPRTAGLASLNARRPDQNFQRAVTADKSIGNSIYHSLQVKAERRFSSGLTFLAAYTFSKAISGPSDIGGQVGGGSFIGAPQDVYYMAGDRAVSGFDVGQRYVQTVLYDIPFARRLHGAAKYVLDGWQLSTIMTYQYGFPAPISFGVDTTGTGVGSRPDWVAGQNGNLPGDQRTWQHWFNTAAFAQTPFGRFGTSPRTGAIRLPGQENIDFSVTKFVRFKEKRSFEFRTEFFNLMNHFNPDPGTVDLNIRSATFGSVGGGVQGITTRVIQLGAKLNF